MSWAAAELMRVRYRMDPSSSSRKGIDFAVCSWWASGGSAAEDNGRTEL